LLSHYLYLVNKIQTVVMNKQFLLHQKILKVKQL